MAGVYRSAPSVGPCLHLAAYAGVRYSEVSPQSYERSNVRCLIVLPTADPALGRG